jgi:hypothetical protein
MLQHTGRFGQGFISKEECDNNAAFAIIPWPASSYLNLFLSLKSAQKGRGFSLRMQRKS